MKGFIFFGLLVILFSCKSEDQEYRSFLGKFPLIHEEKVVGDNEIAKILKGERLDQRLVKKYIRIDDPYDPSIIDITNFYPMFRIDFSEEGYGCFGYITRRISDSVVYIIKVGNYGPNGFCAVTELKSGSLNQKSDSNLIIITPDKIINFGNDTLETNFGIEEIRNTSVDDLLPKK